MSAALLQQEQTPYYARRNSSGFYTWEGRELPSVTTILSIAPGQHLMSWYAKMAAMRAASHLVAAGVRNPIGVDEKLEEFCAFRDEAISKADAVEKIYEWQHVMREAERYRDHKARIGSVTHHAVYEHALGLRIDDSDLEDYARHIAIRFAASLWERKGDPTFLPSDEQCSEVARLAVPYIKSALEWIEMAQPEWDMIGQEAAVFSLEHGYAGTIDAIAHFRKDVWERSSETLGPWFAGAQKVRMAMDFKTSNSLSKSVQLQIEAYASAEFIGLVESGQRFDIGDVDGTAALHIGPHAAMAGLEDEFGTLESKAGRLGSKLFTWPRSEDVFDAFLGLVAFYRVMNDLPRADQQRRRSKAEPRPTMRDVRPSPF